VLARAEARYNSRMEIRQRRKPGPKGKGARTATPVYLPDEFRAEVVEIARRDGLPITDVVTRMVAAQLGRPAPDYCRPKTPQVQEELPLTKAS
jgi:hypothetical protein